MNSGYILWLQVDGTLIICFGLLIFTKFVPAEGTIVKSLEMIWVNFDCILVVFDSVVEFTLLSICKASVVIKIGLARFYRYCFCKAFDGFVVITFSVQ